MPSEERKAKLLKRKSLFIVATNELDDTTLSANSVKLIEGVDAMLLTSPSKIEDGLLHRAAQLSPKLFRTKLGVSSVVDRQQSPHDQGRHDLAG